MRSVLAMIKVFKKTDVSVDDFNLKLLKPLLTTPAGSVSNDS